MTATMWGVPVRVQRRYRPPGDAGARQTLAQLRDMVRRSAAVPAIVALARALVRPAARGDLAGQIRLVRAWVQAHTRWTADPDGQEYLVPPAVMLARIAGAGIAPGDCDDVAALAATLLKAAGIRARLTAIAFEPSPQLRHVLAEGSPAPGVWVDLDTTRPAITTARPKRALALRV